MQPQLSREQGAGGRAFRGHARLALLRAPDLRQSQELRPVTGALPSGRDAPRTRSHAEAQMQIVAVQSPKSFSYLDARRETGRGDARETGPNPKLRPIKPPMPLCSPQSILIIIWPHMRSTHNAVARKLHTATHRALLFWVSSLARALGAVPVGSVPVALS